jgi:hypothetical protein
MRKALDMANGMRLSFGNFLAINADMISEGGRLVMVLFIRLESAVAKGAYMVIG